MGDYIRHATCLQSCGRGEICFSPLFFCAILYIFIYNHTFLCYSLSIMKYTVIYYVSKNGQMPPERLTHDIEASSPEMAISLLYEVICNPKDTKKWGVEYRNPNEVTLVDKINKITHTFSDVSVKGHKVKKEKNART